MAVPALKLDGARGAARGLARAARRGGLGAGGAGAAARRLAERGAPVRRDEYWKFTDPAA